MRLPRLALLAASLVLACGALFGCASARVPPGPEGLRIVYSTPIGTYDSATGRYTVGGRCPRVRTRVRMSEAQRARIEDLVRTSGILGHSWPAPDDCDSEEGPAYFDLAVELDGERGEIPWNDCPTDPLGAHSAATRALVAEVNELIEYSRSSGCTR
jgi:hypothetical protein